LRVVSLIASATEIVCALGARGELVARSHECDFPHDVEDLPALTRPKLDTKRDSLSIDRDVKRLLEQGLAVYEVDADRLKALKPDVIVTQDQCEVCAVSLADVERAVCTWTDQATRIVSLRPDSLADAFRDFRNVAAALGRPESGEALVSDIERRMAAIAQKARGLGRRPRIACVEWIEPLMAGGNWVPELVEMAGGENLFGEAGKHSPWMTWEALAAADPDVILVLPCGFDIPRTAAEMGPLLQRAGWADLKAVREGQVYLADGNQYFNRPGPRLAESLEILAEILHPQAFPFGWEGRGWVRLATS
jgi:iron complex transport system substrate-binding protein